VLYAHPLRIAQGICLAGIALSAMPCMLKNKHRLKGGA